QIILHTLESGSQPAWAVHLYCKDCHCNYHTNFYVCNGQHTYYPGLLLYLQVSEHHFVERKLAEMWTNQHLIGLCLATNCARIFVACFAGHSAELFRMLNWPFTPTLTTEHVWDAFVILALLRDHTSCSLPLVISVLKSGPVRFF
ncbi:hypothetical protein PAXINDRAFT_64364, partial [Paxillus involutus ATCC 200175]